MGLNPSCNSVVGEALPVLGDPPFPHERAQIAIKELRRVVPAEALAVVVEDVERKVWKKGTRGAEMAVRGMHKPYDGDEGDMEWVYLKRVVGCAYGWKFTRLWYYWTCSTEGNPIPHDVAERLNKDWGKQLRVGGYAGGRDVVPPGDVDGYHVDTLDALRVLFMALLVMEIAKALVAAGRSESPPAGAEERCVEAVNEAER